MDLKTYWSLEGLLVLQEVEYTMNEGNESFPKCEYCREPYKTRGRFTIFCPRSSPNEPLRSQQDSDNMVLSFCLPECACAYNYYMSKDKDGEHSQRRHQLMEQVYERTINMTPPRNMLREYLSKGGLKREQWIDMCRNNLDKEDALVAKRELSNLVVDQ